MRIDKLLAHKGLGSRKEVKMMLKKGAVSVNNQVEKDPGFLVTEEDEIFVEGRKIQYQDAVYLMLNKPAGVVSAVSDPKEKTVIDLIPKEKYQKGIFPVGRLDKDTEGLLLLTNDGELSHNLLVPNKHVWKRYWVELDKPLEERLIEEFQRGVLLEGKEHCKSAKLEILTPFQCQVMISEGKYHQIKRMFQTFDYKVVYLKRLQMGTLVLDEHLLPGEIRSLSEQEVEELKNERE